MNPPPIFPNIVCWNSNSVLDVANTVALSVRASIFHATHSPSPISRLNVATTQRTTAAYTENDLLRDFLAPGQERLFCVAVGDSGSGKSHLIRWLCQEAEGQHNKEYRIVRIPRHAANLADVLRHILADDFKGEEVDRIRKEIQRTSDLTPQGARVKILDALSFVLDPLNREKSSLRFPDDEEHQDIILPLLPAMLHDSSIRSHLFKQGELGIVDRLAKHVMGVRKERSDSPTNLRWVAQDLYFPPVVSNTAGGDAAQLASWLLNDEKARNATAEVLNRALAEAWPALVGLERGNLRAAMLEIRKQLKSGGKQLLLFLEDLSVSEGMDAELIESLIVKPSEENNELCVLRSIVGVTNEDFRLMPSNIKGRLDLAVSFDVPIEKTEETVEVRLAEFASRYLNAARYSLEQLDEWDIGKGHNDELPSFCEESRCPNRTECHRVFGQIDGRGLYPFSAITLERLYVNLQGEERSAFNPRLLVGQVLGEFLKRADSQIRHQTYPGEDLREWFRLREVGAEVETRLNQKYGALASRVRTAMELYSEQPWLGTLGHDVAEKFGLPSERGLRTTEKRSALEAERETPASHVVKKDSFDLWFQENRVDDKDLNIWRRCVFDAINGARDWDSDPLGPLFYERFKRTFIHFEGQHVAKSGDIKILIKPNAEVAVAIRGLVSGFKTRDEIVLASNLIDIWTDDICAQLRKIWRPAGASALSLAVHLLALGALVRGLVPEGCDRSSFLRAMFSKWDDVSVYSPNRSSNWNQLNESLIKWGPKIREWLLRQIGGSKGGQVGAGTIDIAVILEDVNSAHRRVQTDFNPEKFKDWDTGTFDVLLELASRISKYLEPAIVAEVEYCNDWLQSIEAACGERSTRDLGVLLKQAFARGRDANAFNNSKVTEYSSRCDSFTSGAVDHLLQAARGTVSEKARNRRLHYLSQLRRGDCDDAAETLRLARLELDRANEFLEKKLKESAVDELAQLESQALKSVAELRTLLENLLEDEP